MDFKHSISKEFIEHMKSVHVVIERMSAKCMECGATFQSIEKYHLHLLSHVEMKNGDIDYDRFVKRFKCSECGQKFVQKSTLEIHETVHKPFPHTCYCGVGYYLKSDYLTHQKLVHTVTFKEELEKLTFRKKRALKNASWTPTINYTGPKPKQDYSTDLPRVKGPRLKAELRIRSSPVREENVKSEKKYHRDIRDRVLTSKRKNNNLARHKGIKKFSCGVCHKKYPHKGNLESHMRTHTGERPFPCSFCKKSFKEKMAKQIHERTHTGERPYHCEICDKRFTQRGALKLHLLRHAGVKNVACNICGKAFLGKSNMETHLRTHTGEKPFSCNFCGKPFSDQSAHKRHERTHTGEKPYACSFCDMKFSDASGRIEHEKRHKKKKDFKCELCSKPFYTIHQVRLHKNSVHSYEKRYECDKCGKGFALKIYLAAHIKNVHGRRLHDFECDYCGFKTNTKQNISQHIKRTHKNEKLYECNECNWKFSNKHLLEKHHNAVHSRLHTVECDMCKKKYPDKAMLYPHMLKHLNIKCENCPKLFTSRKELERHKVKGCIKCDICLVGFINHHRLKQHYSVHKWVRNYECTECFKKFKNLSSLKKHHMNLHSKERNFECDYCGDSFPLKKHLLAHIYDRHLDYLYCNICKRAFYSDSELNRHKSKGCQIKQIVCEICDHVFKSGSGLRQHLLTHTKRMFECHHCGQKVRYKHSVLRHMRLMHKEVLGITKKSKKSIF